MESEKGVGTTVRIDLPNRPPVHKSGTAPKASLSGSVPAASQHLVKSSAPSLPEHAVTPASATVPSEYPGGPVSAAPLLQSFAPEMSALELLQSQILESPALPDPMQSVNEPAALSASADATVTTDAMVRPDAPIPADAPVTKASPGVVAEPSVAATLSDRVRDQGSVGSTLDVLLESVDPPDHSIAQPIESNPVPVHMEI